MPTISTGHNPRNSATNTQTTGTAGGTQHVHVCLCLHRQGRSQRCAQSWIPVRACCCGLCRTRLIPRSYPDRHACGFQTDRHQWSKQSCFCDLVSQVFLSLTVSSVRTRSTSGQCWHRFTTRWCCNHTCLWTARNYLNYEQMARGGVARRQNTRGFALDLRFLNFDWFNPAPVSMFRSHISQLRTKTPR